MNLWGPKRTEHASLGLPTRQVGMWFHGTGRVGAAVSTHVQRWPRTRSPVPVSHQTGSQNQDEPIKAMQMICKYHTALIQTKQIMQILYNVQEGAWVWGGSCQTHPQGHVECNSYDEGPYFLPSPALEEDQPLGRPPSPPGERGSYNLGAAAQDSGISNSVLSAGFVGRSDPWCSCPDTAAGPALSGNPDLSVLPPPIPFPSGPPSQVKPLITHLQASGGWGDNE